MSELFAPPRVLTIAGRDIAYAPLAAVESRGYSLSRLPFSLRILLENLLRREDGVAVTRAEIEAVAGWDPQAMPSQEIAFMPARVLLQDFTGVPAVVDLAAMRDAMVRLGADPERINPLSPAELVIDHSVQVDEYGSEAAFLINSDREFERNRERYEFLRWGQGAFANFQVVPPSTGIVHQVNLEYLARGVMTGLGPDGREWAWPDTLVGTDSHTTMINGLGVLGWGVGGIEAEAAMLGQPISMLIPQVVGFRLVGTLKEGSTATDLVLLVTETLRRHGVVGKFVEFFGPGLAGLPLADRATIANMAPEYGATCGIFPIDRVAVDYLRFTNRTADADLVELYARTQGLWHDGATPEAEYSDVLELDLSTVEPALAGPKRPQDRVALSRVAASFRQALPTMVTNPVAVGTPASVPIARWEGEGGDGAAPAVDTENESDPHVVRVEHAGETIHLRHGSVVIAAITSCTNTSNPSVMVAAGLLARKAVARGLKVAPGVKTSLAPGSKVVTRYLEQANLMTDLEALRFHLVGYGCTTCIGNSGPLAAPISAAIHEHGLVAVAVLSGNRNFEGRISSDVRANYLASPPLVVAYALAGRIDIDLVTEPLGRDRDGNPVFLKDIWPSQKEIADTVQLALRAEMFSEEYASVFEGDEHWRSISVPEGNTYRWDDRSTYIANPPYFENMGKVPEPVRDIVGARVLAWLGDSVTTDHISPAGSIKRDSPAGKYLMERGVAPREFNSYGSRRGHHEVMKRGTFANVRLRNRLVPEIEGGFTQHLPSGEPMSIFDAAERYQAEGRAQIIIAGREYGSGSSRDWAAKGPRLLGVRAVIAESYERIHRSNLVGMGILPLEMIDGTTIGGLGLTGHETFDITGVAACLAGDPRQGLQLEVVAHGDKGETRFPVRLRIDTPQEVLYYQHGGILHYVLRSLAAR